MQYVFKDCLEKFGEVGYVQNVWQSVVRIEGLPQAGFREVMVAENGEKLQVVSIGEDCVDVVRLNDGGIRVGERVARTGEDLQVKVGDGMLGQVVDGLGGGIEGEARSIEGKPLPLTERMQVAVPLETGVTMVDVALPLARGQRQLVIGDRNSGKSRFLLQVMTNQVRKGAIGVYCLTAKRQTDLDFIRHELTQAQVINQVVMVAAPADKMPGEIVAAPFTAMCIAEYFRDLGREVMLVLDDLSLHATFWRQMALLLKRFPGRNSYPGDIFYLHARLLERAGQFKTGAITCLPVAEAVMGDLSGYIQTNLMAVTDGHWFFDGDLANQGRRPAVNPFLSVTRVGRQTQSVVMADVGRVVSEFLNHDQNLRQFLHFGAELTEKVQRELKLGERVYELFSLTAEETMPQEMSVWLLSNLWSGKWEAATNEAMLIEMRQMATKYQAEARYRAELAEKISGQKSFMGLVGEMKQSKI